MQQQAQPMPAWGYGYAVPAPYFGQLNYAVWLAAAQAAHFGPMQ